MSGGSAWRVEITRRAQRDLKRLDPPVRERILAALAGLRAVPPTGDIKQLTNTSPTQWRLRVGDWRVIFTRDDAIRVVAVVRVLPRARAYRD